MSKMSYEEAFISVMVDYICDEIIKRYTAKSKSALVLFSGALIGLDESLESLKMMEENGWKLTVAMSESAAAIISEGKIREKINPQAIIKEGSPVNYRTLADENNYIVIPSLTINTTAKVANAISDNLLTRIISYGMAKGKPIVAAIDGCCPDNGIRAKIGFKVTEQYKVKLRNNLQALQDYGIVLTSAKNLGNKVEKVLVSSFGFGNMKKATKKSEQKKEVKQSTVVSKNGSIKISKKVISQSDIAQHKAYKTIIVDAKAMVTALANDEAYRLGINIVKE